MFAPLPTCGVGCLSSGFRKLLPSGSYWRVWFPNPCIGMGMLITVLLLSPQNASWSMLSVASKLSCMNLYTSYHAQCRPFTQLELSWSLMSMWRLIPYMNKLQGHEGDHPYPGMTKCCGSWRVKGFFAMLPWKHKHPVVRRGCFVLIAVQCM